jgi:hypothetical protein
LREAEDLPSRWRVFGRYAAVDGGNVLKKTLRPT